MPRVYIYVVARDFGFAPNPFHGACTLATCKADVRRTAQVGDWVIGMGGDRLKATGRCLFAMQVTSTLTFDEYWGDPAYRAKRPSRNGTRKSMVGDNIYHRSPVQKEWIQEDSHHSRPDGSPDTYNIATDTRTDRVLLSHRFLYFGRSAVEVPTEFLDAIGYANRRAHRVFPGETCKDLLAWLNQNFAGQFNQILDDPFDFARSGARYSYQSDRVIGQ